MPKVMIIAESLIDQSVLVKEGTSIVDRYDHLLDGEIPVEIIMVSVSKNNMFEMLRALANNIKFQFYAHLVDHNTMYVVYTSTVAIVRKGNPDDEATCLKLADIFGVPHGQLPFHKMFDFGHAEND